MQDLSEDANWDLPESSRRLLQWDEQATALTGVDLAGPNTRLTTKLRIIAKKARSCTPVEAQIDSDAQGANSGISLAHAAPAVVAHPLDSQAIDAMLADDGMAPPGGSNHKPDSHEEDGNVQKKVKMSLQPPPKSKPGDIPKEAVAEVRKLLSTFDSV